MDDRTLLEKAAKAAGMTMHVVGDGAGAATFYTYPNLLLWSPLTDDGDAFRLAVKLGLLVYVMLDAGFTGIRLPGEHIGGKYDEVEMHGTDPFAATRRAIVRAAAAMADSTEGE